MHFQSFNVEGKVREANRFLTQRVESGGVLDPNSLAEDKSGVMDKTVFKVFKDKHPEPRTVDENAFIHCDDLPVLVDVDVTSGYIEKVARKIRGSAGPSGTDSDNWSNFLLRYGNHSKRLREAVAASTRKHANEIVEWDEIRALLAKRGVGLDKCPGVRPIGIMEVRQRIEKKAMVLVTGIDVQEVCGADNLSGGIKAGIEGGVHAVNKIFDDDDFTEGMLLVDASNAFNSLSREAALWNCKRLGSQTGPPSPNY